MALVLLYGIHRCFLIEENTFSTILFDQMSREVERSIPLRAYPSGQNISVKADSCLQFPLEKKPRV